MSIGNSPPSTVSGAGIRGMSEAEVKVIHFQVRFAAISRQIAVVQTDVCFGPQGDLGPVSVPDET
jgi:hypothetical protein